MNNQELEKRIKNILNTSNFFDMVVLAQDFEKEYTNSDFYKMTKMPLIDVIKNCKMWYLFNFESILESSQRIVSSLNLENVNDIINQFGDLFMKENEEVLNIAREFSDILK